MSLQRTDNNSANVERRQAGYHSNVWEEYFLTHNVSRQTDHIPEKEMQCCVEKLKLDVRDMIMSPKFDKLNLIDQIQRLGIAYHFEKEIDEVLEQIHKSYFELDGVRDCNNGDLHTTALLFRLLRQQGHSVPCDVFNEFKTSDGQFSESLTTDMRGLLSLYEASHSRMHGEDTLEEALAFTVSSLKSLLDEGKLNPLLAAEVRQALKQCLHKGLTRARARHYIQIYQNETSTYSQILVKLAKLDFNLLQKQHQEELCDITRWWKDLEVKKNFPFARDRLVESYFWILGTYFEPEYSIARNMFTKVFFLTTIMDDIYDAYGTITELKLLTDAIDEWDIKTLDQLPDYMQIFYRALLDTYSEFEETLAALGRSYRLSYAKAAMKTLAMSYFKEALWFNQNYIPATLEEYISLGLQTSGYDLMALSSFLGMGDDASKDAFDWLLADPKILKSSKFIGRVMNDIASHKFEQQRGHGASAVECYMKQHGVSEQEAEEELRKMIEDAWKDINAGCLKPMAVPMPLLTRILNLTRSIEVIYQDKNDHYTHSRTGLKDYIDAVLANPITS